MKKLLLTTTALVAFSAGAFAAGVPVREKVSAPVFASTPFSWNGFYIGATLGANQHETRFSAPNGGWNMSAGDSLTTKRSGLLGGGTAGYNMQFGAFVAGVEGDYSFSDTDATKTVNFDGDVTGHSRLKSIGTLRARLGMAFDRTLVYATGGWAFARTSTYLNDGGYGYSRKQSANGWTLGGGVEQALGNNFSVKGEVLYYDLGRRTVRNQLFDAWDYRESNKGFIARVGLNYNFGGPALPARNRF